MGSPRFFYKMYQVVKNICHTLRCIAAIVDGITEILDCGFVSKPKVLFHIVNAFKNCTNVISAPFLAE